VPHTIFYDGLCGLCNRLNHFVLARDRADQFRFAALQGRRARETLLRFDKDPTDLDTFYVLSEEGALYSRSRAILFVLRELGGVWKLSRVLGVLPTPLLDGAYNLVARYRYRLFGKYDACAIPSPAHRQKFLED
jgi:predicted DCC family thiol-disulfide oxidoreductase YuxK